MVAGILPRRGKEYVREKIHLDALIKVITYVLSSVLSKISFFEVTQIFLEEVNLFQHFQNPPIGQNR